MYRSPDKVKPYDPKKAAAIILYDYREATGEMESIRKRMEAMRKKHPEVNAQLVDTMRYLEATVELKAVQFATCSADAAKLKARKKGKK